MLPATLPVLIPWWEPAVYHLGPIPIDPWAVLVCIGFVVGMEVARARGISIGLDTRDVVDGAVFIVLLGFVVAHWVHVVAYNPELMELDGQFDMMTAGKELLNPFGGVSSNGGFLGAVIGTILFYTLIRKRDFWIHADNGMYGFVFGYVFGRLGCFSVHDHPGATIEEVPWLSFMMVDWQPGPARLDMALVEACWLALIALVFFAVNRKWKGSHGKFIALWCMLYAPVRFGLDFLRAVDRRLWLGLTPAQYGSILMFVAGAVIIVRLWKKRSEGEEPSP
ncbi:MAG TPA: prolipoprotein diacylglyceryl transferase family protein [Myxococcota bacterium]|nr:prolipoprotein diacylglyceryl transferase family protein [Myxococcota bacterium]